MGRNVRKLCLMIIGTIGCVFIMQSIVLANALGIPDSEYNALVALYNSTNGANWTNHTNWLTNRPNWYGVTVQGGHVVSIIISWNGLTGTLPPDLGNLTELQNLHLFGAQLTGNIPPELGRLKNLEMLVLFGNQLTGNIPPELGNLTNLRTLGLFCNQLTGTIPPELGKLVNLQWLNLGSNQLTGTIPLELISLTNLQSLCLDNNELTGSIPPEIGNLTNLQEMSLGLNQLTGKIPSELGHLVNLQDLYLEMNQLSGQIPSQLGNLTNLKSLYLSCNQLTGTIPHEIGNLTKLEDLELGNNQLTGEIPCEIGCLSNLQNLYLNCNQLTGEIPGEIGNLVSLQNMYLLSNQLSGEIPHSIGNLVNLREVDIDRNQLTGAIPVEIGKLTNLRWLNLEWNRLTGTIPVDIGNLTKLQDLTLNYNSLTGTIPQAIGKLTDLQYLSLNSNQLTGPIPSAIADLVNLEILGISSNQFAGEIPTFITRLNRGRCVQLDYNAFRSSDQEVIAFLAEKGNDWQSAQTVPPADVATSITSAGLTISWTPINYCWDEGYYEVGYSSAPGGPYVFDPSNRTYDKRTSSLTLRSIDPTNPVYFTVRTVSLAGWQNQSTLVSELSQEVVMMPPPQDKLAGNDSIVVLNDMVVTAVFDDCYYVEKPNRTFGIQVRSNGSSPKQGEMVNVFGTLRTNGEGERYVEAITDPIGPPPVPMSIQPNFETTVKPVFMTNKTLGGGNLSFNSATGAGQRGIEGGSGLNNIGLFVRTTGKVIFAGRDWLYIDDGSGLDDGSGIKGLYVDAKGYPTVPVGSVVWVEGISSCDLFKGRIVNTLRATNGGIISSPPVAASKSTVFSAKELVNPRKAINRIVYCPQGNPGGFFYAWLKGKSINCVSRDYSSYGLTMVTIGSVIVFSPFMVVSIPVTFTTAPA